MSRNHYSWESSLEAMAEERNTLNYGIQKAHWSLSDTQAYLLPAWPCSQPEGRNMVMSSSTCVSNGKDGSSAAPLVLLRWLQFDLPSQIPCTLYKSECPTLSLVTDSKEGLRTGEHRFSLYQMPLKPLRSTSLWLLTPLWRLTVSSRKQRRKSADNKWRQCWALLRLPSIALPEHWAGAGVLSALQGPVAFFYWAQSLRTFVALFLVQISEEKSEDCR